ncbi:ABC transporter ATP-binding protein [Bradyrhizobium sp. LHD-71]|uniref:ABC transporter ATP-binding protein n=1 Tax=Bradyrhizobium sp. LHD-71 TaxID=3072141 RepID=UPI00280FC621|nr:ABC transporter ATP-binding protein [Bradyrhizobium sp. LHD-71]MDQ8726928.1 ABC transporter ATP-binding protein [Bradyrhizobium sp. LHD-71]
MVQDLPSAEAPAADKSGGEDKPLLRIASVSKRFGGVRAVDDLSLDIRSGEFFALLGPSGCGKSTLLRMLAGFETPDAGRILLDGADIVAVPPHQRPINMMFQNYALFPHLDVAGNIAFGLKRAGMRRADIGTRVAEMLALTQLQGLERRRPDQLSGGQRQRVALARSLALRPRMLLLDEPLAALDRKLRASTQAELQEVQRRLGTTFIIVTHDQDEAMTVADRIGVMNGGRLIQVASPRELYETPNSSWVASFVGDVNFIDGLVVSQKGSLLTLRTEEAGTVIVTSTIRPVAGMTVQIAIRPEKIRISSETASGEIANALRGEIVEVNYLGGVSVYSVRLSSGSLMRVTAANLVRSETGFFAPGQRVSLSFSPDACIVLDK